MAGIVGWGCYIPRYRIKVDDIADAWCADANQIKNGLKIIEKSVPSIDEDAATIAVQASKNSIKSANINPEDIGAIYIGSESHPYAVKPTGTIVGQAIGVGNCYTTADFEFACKAGTAAVQVGLAFVKAKMAQYVLAGGCDTAQAAPGDPLEYAASAGGAMYILGVENVAAKINHTLSYTSDTPDFWRRNYQEYPSHAGAFTGEPAYFEHIIKATNLMFDAAKSNASDYDFVVFHQPNGKFPTRVAKRLGFKKEQFETGLLVDRIGNTYSGASLLGLAAVLDKAKPGQRVLVTSYGSGAGSDSFDITITENIIDAQKRSKTIDSYINDKSYLSYVQYLRNTGKL